MRPSTQELAAGALLVVDVLLVGELDVELPMPAKVLVLEIVEEPELEGSVVAVVATDVIDEMLY